MNKIINFHKTEDINWFESVILLLKSKYTMIDISDVEAFYYDHKKLKNTCHLTVDDGDKSFYKVMFPVLRKHNVPATLFVSPKICKEGLNFWFQEIKGYNESRLQEILKESYHIPEDVFKNYKSTQVLRTFPVGKISEVIKKYQEITNTAPKPPQNMTVAEVIEVKQSGLITIGAHTMNHPFLTNEDDAASRDEIISSITELSKLLGEEIRYFAYPKGVPNVDFSEREMNILRNTNIRLVFSTEPRNLSYSDDKYAVPRFGITSGSLKFIRAKLAMGSYWEVIRNLKVKKDIKMKAEVLRILRTGDR